MATVTVAEMKEVDALRTSRKKDRRTAGSYLEVNIILEGAFNPYTSPTLQRGKHMNYSMTIATLCLAATAVLYGCGSLAACGAPPADPQGYGWVAYDACLERYKQEKRDRARDEHQMTLERDDTVK